MKKTTALGLITLLLCNNENAIAQQNALDSVIIRENRLPSAWHTQNRNIQVMDAKQIAKLPVKSVNELLSYVAGVDLRQRGPFGTQSDVSIDGSTFDQVLVLINGVKMSDPQTGHHLLNVPIPLSSIDHIEVLRGPAARIYGVNALAGAINIITRVPQQTEVSAQVYAGSSFKTDTASGDTYLGWGAQASAALAAKNQSHIFSAAHDEGNGYRYNTAYDAYRLFYQNQVKLNDKNSIEAMGGYISNSFGGNGYYAAPADAESEESVETATGSIAWNYRPNPRILIKPRVSYRYNHDDYIFIRQKPEAYHNIHETNVVTGEIQSAIQTKKGTIGAGVEWRSESINSTNLGKRNRDNLGIYAEYKHNFSEKFNASAGVYGNYNTDYDFTLFPGIDAGYSIDRHWKLYANATTGQRLPTYTDLYYKGPSNIGNDQLKPENAVYGEGGIRYHHALVSAQASYFYRHVTDFIDWVKATATNPWQPQNFQSVNTNGVTAQVTYQLSQHLQASDKYQSALQASYTYLNPTIESPTTEISKYAVEALRHQFTASFRNTLFGHFDVNINARYLYRINANDYTLLDARIGYHHRQWTIFADLNNILDTQYKEIGAIPLPGSWYTFGISYRGIKRG